MVLSGTGVEATSGVKSVTVVTKNNGGTGITSTTEATPNLISVSGGYATTTATVSGSITSGWTWKATVPPAYYNDGDVQIVITDNAGNSATNNAFTLALDDDSPIISLTSHNTTLMNTSGVVNGKTVTTLTDSENKSSTSESTVNGTVTLKGTASDSGALSSMTLYYSLSDSSASSTSSTVQGTSLTGTAATNWEFNVPFSTTTGMLGATTTDSATEEIYVKLLAVDTAANESWYTYKFFIDRNADRPVVTLISIDTPLAGETPTLQSTTLRGSISDDDGVTSARVSFDDCATWNTLTITNGVFTFTSLGDDGTKNMYFSVTDKTGTTFSTKYSSTLGQTQFTRPYFKYGNSDSLISGSLYTTLCKTYDSGDVLTSTADYGLDASAAVSFKKDTQNPTLGAAYIIRGQYVNGTSIVTTDGGTTAVTAEALTSSIMLGGTKYRYFKIYAGADDSNGIASVKTTVTTIASSGAAMTSSAENGNGTWTTDILDASGFASGVKSVTLIATDKCGLLGTSTYSITLDNSAPTAAVSTPLSTEEVTGDSISIKGTMSDADSSAGIAGSGVADIQYLIPVNSTVSSKTSFTAAEAKAMTGWKGTTADESATVSWEFDFDGTVNATILSYVYNGSSNVTNYYISDTNGLYVVPIIFKLTDALGNCGYITDYTLKFNRFGDRPITTVVYPDPSYKTSSNAVVLGGNIRVSGSATDNGAVGAVYMQIDWDADGDYDAADFDAMVASKAYTSANFYALNTTTYSGATLATFKTHDADDGFWGYKINGTASWYQTLNASGELEATSALHLTSTNQRLVSLRFVSVDTNTTLGSWSSSVYIITDKSAPRIGSTVTPYVAQYGSDNTGTSVTASQTWVDSMYLKGSWYLWTSVEDESNIASYTVKINGDDVTSSTSVTATAFGNPPTDPTGGYKLKILIPSTTSGLETVVVTATDKSTPSQTQSATYKIYIDNTPPVIDNMKGNGNSLEGTPIPSVSNTDYLYTLSANITDEDSGFKRMVFYYLRTDSSSKTARIYDPFGFTTSSSTKRPSSVTASTIRADLTDSNTALTAVAEYSDSGSYTAGSITKDTVDSTNSVCLYGIAYTGTRPSDTQFTNTAIETNMHIRADGLIKIGGVYHKIVAVDYTTGTVTFDSSIDTTYKDAFFPYAQIADNTSTETYSWTSGVYSFTNSTDDGDGMIESVSNAGNTWKFSASVYSDVIPDGPVSIVCVVFDEAGNIATRVIKTKVENNPLRVAQVYLGTDLNGNGIFSDDEFSKYDIQNVEGSSQQAFTLDTLKYSTYADSKVSASTRARFIAKDKLAAAVQFTGGNYDYNDSRPIYYIYNDSATSAANPLSSSNYTLAQIATHYTSAATNKMAEGNTTYLASTSSYYSLPVAYLTDTQLNKANTESAEGTGKTIGFSFWDSTEETTAGVDSYWAYINVKLDIDVVDGTAPTASIDPFYWKGLTNNSISGSSSVESKSDLAGHIELEGDWAQTNKYAAYKAAGTSADTSVGAEYDLDPKVSGSIVITGTVYDEKRLSTINVTATGINLGAGIGVENTLATYSTTTNNWTGSSGTGYTFSVPNDSMTQNGHTATWKLVLDTSIVTDGTSTVCARNNVVVKVRAKDTASTSANYSSTTAATIKTVYATATEAASGSYYETAVLANSATSDSSIATVVVPSLATNITKGSADGTYASVYAYTFTLYPYYQMDIVPYITKVETALSKQKTSNPSVYNRTALGHYPVQSVVSNTKVTLKTSTSETVTLYGFNLNGSSPSVTGITTVDSATAGQLSFNVKELASGKPTITVSSITALNNSNNNDAHGTADSEGSAYANWYNREGNGDTNNILNDDIYFDVWEFNDRAAVPLNGLVGGVQMKINPQTKMLNYAFANGSLFYSMAGKVDSADYSSYYWAGDWDVFTSACVGFTVDDLGYTYSSCSGGDTNKDGDVDTYAMWSSRWGIGAHGTGGTYGGTNAVRLEKIALKTGKGTYAYDLNKNRCLSPEYASSVSGTATNLYHIYYDAICDEIRFRAGTLNITERQSTMGFTDQYTTNAPQYYNINNCQVIANGDSGKDQTQIAGRGAGNYVAIAVAKSGSTDVVCAVWYDSYANNLKYSYIVDPISLWNDSTKPLAGDATAVHWSEAKTIFAEGGEYCHIAVDKNNHIHIAAYAGNGDVKYAYLDTYSADSSYSEAENSCIVDASGTVGEHLTLDVALDSSGNSIPYIGYYTSAVKMPKYAYLVNTSDTTHVPAGVDANERFTGAWEVTVVPTPSRITSNREDKINVGVWKNLTTGKLTDSYLPNTTTVGQSTYSNTLNSYDSTSWSKTYGNGTSNGVLAYQIANGSGSCIETAQMR